MNKKSLLHILIIVSMMFIFSILFLSNVSAYGGNVCGSFTQYYSCGAFKTHVGYGASQLSDCTDACNKYNSFGSCCEADVNGGAYAYDCFLSSSPVQSGDSFTSSSGVYASSCAMNNGASCTYGSDCSSGFCVGNHCVSSCVDDVNGIPHSGATCSVGSSFGICTLDSTKTQWICDTNGAGAVLYGVDSHYGFPVYYADCSSVPVTGIGCATFLGAGYVPNGVCVVGGTCDTGAVYHDTITDKYYGSANDMPYTYNINPTGNTCDSDVSNGVYSANGMQVKLWGEYDYGTCAALGDAVSVRYFSGVGYYYNGCDNGGGGAICSNSQVSGYGTFSPSGVCASNGCAIGVAVCNNSNNFYTAMGSCVNGNGCDVSTDGTGYFANGYVCSGTCVSGSLSSEICDGKDNDCNGKVDDGIIPISQACNISNSFGTCSGTQTKTCSSGAWSSWSACNAKTPNPEVCNNKDDNCNGQIDEGCDNDKDTYADSSMSCVGSFLDGNDVLRPCMSNYGDCNDANAAIHPGAVEICDGKDNDCNGQVDEGVGPTSQVCAITNGVGSQTRTCNGVSGWGAYNICIPTSCNAGYHISGNSCIADCVITSVSVGPGNGCVGNTCSDGNTLNVSTTYTGDCSSGVDIQVDAQSAYGTCILQYSSGDMTGVINSNIIPALSATGGTKKYTDTLGSVPSDCNNTNLTTVFAAIRDGLPVAGSNLTSNIYSGAIPSIKLLAAGCGNGLVQGIEQCDDGNTNDHDACRNNCKWNVCNDSSQRLSNTGTGGGDTGSIEECDRGGANSNYGNCSLSCKIQSCNISFMNNTPNCYFDTSLSKFICSNGDGSSVKLNFSGTVCSFGHYVQVDFSSADGSCSLKYSSAGMNSRMSGSLYGISNPDTRVLNYLFTGSVPSNCIGKNLTNYSAELYAADPSAYGTPIISNTISGVLTVPMLLAECIGNGYIPYSQRIGFVESPTFAVPTKIDAPVITSLCSNYRSQPVIVSPTMDYVYPRGRITLQINETMKSYECGGAEDGVCPEDFGASCGWVGTINIDPDCGNHSFVKCLNVTNNKGENISNTCIYTTIPLINNTLCGILNHTTDKSQLHVQCTGGAVVTDNVTGCPVCLNPGDNMVYNYGTPKYVGSDLVYEKAELVSGVSSIGGKYGACPPDKYSVTYVAASNITYCALTAIKCDYGFRYGSNDAGLLYKCDKPVMWDSGLKKYVLNPNCVSSQDVSGKFTNYCGLDSWFANYEIYDDQYKIIVK